MRPQRQTLPHEPALDGLRGLAVAAVLAYHLALANNLEGLERFTAGGFLGVSAFFTLSGYLICSLLILEFDSMGYISPVGFWSRRFRRLMPASLLTLVAVVTLTPVLGTDQQLSDLPREVWSALGYVINWRFIATGSDYAATFGGAPSPLKHFWSLAVEEQAYLFLPVVVGLTMRIGRRRRHLTTAAFLALVGASFAAMWVLGDGAYSNRVYMGTDTRLAELGVGGLLAVVMAGREHKPSMRRLARFAPLGPLGLVLLIGLWMLTPLRSDWLYRGGLVAHALVVGLVIVAGTRPSSLTRSVLSVRPLTALGRISYGVYLFHWPLIWWMTPERLGVAPAAAAGAQLVATIAIAAASLRFVERPIRIGTAMAPWRRVVVAGAGMVGVAVMALMLPAADTGQIVALETSSRPVVPSSVVGGDDEPGDPGDSTDDPGPTTTVPPPPVKVMTVGDSFGISIGVGLEDRAATTGDIATFTAAIVGCGFGRGGWNKGIGLERQFDEECNQRDETLSNQFQMFPPDVVLVAGGLWDITDRKLAGSNTWTHIGQPAYDEFLLSELIRFNDIVARSGGLVIWVTLPTLDPVYNPQSYMGPPPYSEALPNRSERFNGLLMQMKQQRPESEIIDIASWMRSYPGGEFSPDLRIDGVHFTVDSTKIAADWLVPEIIERYRAP